MKRGITRTKEHLKAKDSVASCTKTCKSFNEKFWKLVREKEATSVNPIDNAVDDND